jgi:hypothetical protein
VSSETSKWDIFELVLDAPASGSPYLDVSLEGSWRVRWRFHPFFQLKS